MSEYSYWFGDVVDKLVSNDLARPRGGTSAPDKIHRMYDDTRKRFGRPLTLMAAEVLKEKVGEDDVVLLITNSHEMDGPVGVATLARAVNLGLMARPIVVTTTMGSIGIPVPERAAQVMPNTCIAAGLLPVPPKHLRERPRRVSILEFPLTDEEGSIAAAGRILDEHKPAVVVASEAMGRNRVGVYHSAFGYALKNRARMDHLLDVAGDRGIPTIALGDNGNEMGFGTIEDVVKKYQPYGEKCQCPCGSGITSVVKADLVLPMTTSNWGCYGIEACLAHLLGNGEVMHDAETEKRVLYACANTGVPDGSTNWTTPTCDGTPHMASVDIVDLLKMTVTQSFLEYERKW